MAEVPSARLLRASSALLACVAACATQAAAGTPVQIGPSDVVMDAMSGELERSRTGLRLDGYERPYYLAYAVKERVSSTVAGKLGALYEDSNHKIRLAWADVRIGDYRLDSSEDDEIYWGPEEEYSPSAVVPLEGDGRAIRHALWLLTDRRYKQALSSYHKLKGQRVYAPDEAPKRPSFSRAPPAGVFEESRGLTMDRERWRATVRALGSRLASDPRIFDATVDVTFAVETRWFVNTEGARVRTIHPMYSIHATAHTRAPDGMLITKSLNRYARSEADLPADAVLLAEADRVVRDLKALRAAPQMEPYTGPAILSPEATGVFFHEVLGHRLEGHRLDSREEGQTFASYLGKPILPTFVSVFDDPTLTRHGPVELNGYYRVDDEGVVAQRVQLVDRGVLRGFLLPRRPVEGFEASNGHGRAQGIQDPVARMGNLIVEAHENVTEARLREMLLAEVRKQGKPFGLIIREITGGATNTSSYGFQAFKGQAQMVYKVDAASGEETLVRGVEIVGTPLVSIGKIMAASDATGVFNGYCGAESGNVPVSTIAPSTLFREIELQRTAREQAKGPILDLPTE